VRRSLCCRVLSIPAVGWQMGAVVPANHEWRWGWVMERTVAGVLPGAGSSPCVYVVIAATDAAALAGLRELVEAAPGLGIVAEAADGKQGGTSGNGLAACHDLTRREREVMELIAAGLSNREIADLLVLSQKTVKNHICRIYQCIGIHERSQAVRRWKEFSEPPGERG
jgi:DNA-binding CsgD family transcriptional regulator